MKVLRIWEEWAIYSPLFTKGLEAAFLKDAKLLQNVFVGKKIVFVKNLQIQI